MEPVILKAPSSFPYDNNKEVQWRYDVQVSKRRQDVSLVYDGHNTSTPKVTNIYGISGMMRSERVFTHPDLQAELKDKGKVKVNETKIEKIGLMVNEKVHSENPEGKKENSGQKEISAEEAT